MNHRIALRATDPRDRRMCFQVPGRFNDVGRDVQHTLSGHAAAALSNLIPLLGCGEEAAAIAFDGLAQTSDFQASETLRTIALEERVHDALLRQLADSLPEASNQPAIMRAARRFHIDLGHGGAPLHLARIAALDSAVCTVLSRLTRAGSPLCADAAITTILIRIRNDEARHVAVSRRLALASGEHAKLRNAAADARFALAKILMLAADSFETLGVDPDVLEQDVSRLPDGLLPA